MFKDKDRDLLRLKRAYRGLCRFDVLASKLLEKEGKNEICPQQQSHGLMWKKVSWGREEKSKDTDGVQLLHSEKSSDGFGWVPAGIPIVHSTNDTSQT